MIAPAQPRKRSPASSESAKIGYAHIITYHFVEFRARTAPFSQDAFASIELVELGVTLYTASAGAFYQTGSTMIWQWFPASVTVDYNPAQTYSLRFT